MKLFYSSSTAKRNLSHLLHDDISGMFIITKLAATIAKLEKSYDKALKHDENFKGNPKFFNNFPKTYYDVTDIVNKNKATLRNFYSSKEDFDKDNEQMAAYVAKQQETHSDKSQIWKDLIIDDFGNDNGKRDCCYLIGRSRIKKRIVVDFRTSTIKTDWLRDFSIFTDTWKIKDIIEKVKNVNPEVESKMRDDKIDIHKGFYGYLFQEKRKGKEEDTFSLIQNKLIELMDDDENKDYELYITGHSLGGALASLTGFALALSDNFPYPIKVVTYAGPTPGHADLSHAMEKLGNMGRIYHCRITRNSDIIPQMNIISTIWTAMTFGMSFSFDSGFRHSGVHLNLFETKDPTFKQTIIDTPDLFANGMAFPFKLWKIPCYHYLEYYEKAFNRDEVKTFLEGMTWETLKKIRQQPRDDNFTIDDKREDTCKTE